jgi:hypothetical protein
MRRTARTVVALLALVTISASIYAFGPTPAWSKATKLFNLTDPRLDEASGLAVGIRSPGILYAQNDSGDSARFFALDASGGGTVAVINVPLAVNVDWEDLAVAHDSRGVASVWLADIGDNGSNRSQIQVYRVNEPELNSRNPAGELTTGNPDIWRLRYPDGPHNAESIVVDPVSHRIYVLTKSLYGLSGLYLVPAHPDANNVQPMTFVGHIQFGTTGTPGGPNLIGQLTATGASMSPDGSVLVVRTYTDAYFWRVNRGDLASAIKRAPIQIALPRQPLGEGIAIRGGEVLIDSEQVGTGVYAIPLPAIPALPPAASSARSSPTPSSSGVAKGARPSAHTGKGQAALARQNVVKNSVILAAALLVATLVMGGTIWALASVMRRKYRR